MGRLKNLKKPHIFKSMKRKRPAFTLNIAALVQSSNAEAAQESAKKAQDLKEVEKEGPANLKEHCVPIRPIGHGAFGTVSLGIYVPSLTLGSTISIVYFRFYKDLIYVGCVFSGPEAGFNR
jgi:hypothetical protein